MTARHVDGNRALEGDIRSIVKLHPLLMLVGALLVTVSALSPSVCKLAIGIFVEQIGTKSLLGAIASILFIAGLSSFLFGRNGGVFQSVRYGLMNMLSNWSCKLLGMCLGAGNIYLGASIVLGVFGQWRIAMMVFYLCCVLAALGLVPRIFLHALQLTPPVSAGSTLQSGRMLGLFSLSTALLIVDQLIWHAN